MGSLWQDLRFAARMLGKNPGFALVAVLTLALGIGANTAIFSLMNAFILRPLPLKDPEQLVLISEVRLKDGQRRTPTQAAYQAWAKSSRALQEIAFAGFNGDPASLTGIGHAERVSAGGCGWNFFSMLGVKPFRGRLFLPEDSPKGQDTAVMITEALWQRVFGADPNVVGRDRDHCGHQGDYRRYPPARVLGAALGNARRCVGRRKRTERRSSACRPSLDV